MTEFAANSHKGHVRDHNEDCYEADSELGLWLVADGVGGHAHGEVASRIARDTVKTELLAGTELIEAVRRAHRAILDEIASRDTASNMGSTIVALHLRGDNNYEISWVGDSRAYMFDGELRQLSRDHNPVSELLACGEITSEQAAAHPEKHVLSQSLGVSESMPVKPGLISGRMLTGEQVLLCSDGLTDELSDDMIRAEMSRHSTPRAQIDALVSAALRAGGRDNITAVIVGDAPVRSTGGSHTDDLETTQSMGKAVISSGDSRVDHGTKIWMILSAIVLVALWLWW
jgi:serine/threonine protein phosphatase PrpC